MMRSFFLSIVALGTVSFGIVGQAGATTVIDRETTIGRHATVFFFASKSCANSNTATLSGFLFGADSISRSTGLPVTRSNAIVLENFGYTDCNGASTGDMNGGPADGLAGPGPALLLATMNTTTTVQRLDNGALLPVAIHLTLVGTGALSSSGGTTETHTMNGHGGPFTLTIVRSAFSNRAANVTGTVTINGDVFDLTGSQGGFDSNSNATITVTKP